MDDYEESYITEVEKEVEEIRSAALKKAQMTHPEIAYAIDRRTVDDYCNKTWDYPGKRYVSFKLPDGFLNKEELIAAIAAETVLYFTKNGGAASGTPEKKNKTTAIVYYSQHHGNTKKLLDAIAAADKSVSLIDVTKHPHADLSAFDRIGLASGVYFSSFAKQILFFADAHLPEGKDVFYIYTHGAPVGGFLKNIRAIAKKKRCRELGKYDCLGFDTFGPFKRIGGIAKGHPNEKELAAAVRFYQGLE